MYPRIKADFQHPVVINSETFPPGHYVFQQVRGPGEIPVFHVTNSQGKKCDPNLDCDQSSGATERIRLFATSGADTEVVLQKIGGKYYLHKSVQGRTRGWEFEIPDNVKGQIAEMNEESVPGSYDETPDVAYQSREGEATMQSNALKAGSAKSEQLTSLTGCLERRTSPDSFYIESSDGKQTNVQAAGNLVAEMANQANHTVRLVGHWSESQAKPNAGLGHDNSFVGDSTHPSQGTNLFHVDRIDAISTTRQK